ncbi:CoA transferase [Variovorax sp. J22P168]|uniref:CaiB/BaiF CoA transferase family protein n=1 Tax=Variovorax jilinensis TaxID=3053513 RepID=UPI002574E732|nr:CoA transferase [Variovorax sp. J22P168]MDM0015170.1 CoA transferase [Variovorax sp. J22P168]
MIQTSSLHSTDAPLKGVRVADFSTMMAGPYCSRWMADMGAEVWKIEPPEGDFMRSRVPLREGRSAYFAHLNAGKKSVVLDLKKAEDAEVARDLMAQSDVLLENYRPGVMQRFGLDYASVRDANPALVYCSISGYGQSGEGSERAAYAPIVHAASGLDLAILELQDVQTQPANCGIQIADVLAATFAGFAIQTALLHRLRTGAGQHIDLALMDALMSLMPFEMQCLQFPGEHSRNLYKPLPTQDGFVVVAPLSQANFVAMSRAMDRPEWLVDPRFREPVARAEHWQSLLDAMAAWTCERLAADCQAQLEAAGVPASRYVPLAEMLRDPQMTRRGGIRQVEDGSGSLLASGLPFTLSASHLPESPRAPDLGEHTHALRAMLAHAATI